MNDLLLKMGFAALLSAIVAMVAVPAVKVLAHRYGAVRAPRERDVHTKPMPMWGGVAMFLAFMLTILVMRLWTGQELTVAVGRGQHPILGIVAGAALVAIIGMFDDHPKYDLSPKWQTLAILSAALIAALLGARIEGVTNPFAPPSTGHHYTSANWIQLPYPVSIAITMAWVFLATKTFDFLDGLDGLAAGVCAISATTMGLMATYGKVDFAVALMAAALAGACVGFLRHNYNPASIFMGTVGSQFLGFVLAMLAVVGTFKAPAAISIILPPLVLGVPILDGLYVAARRILKGKNPTAADKTHIHHRLTINQGLSVRRAVWTIYGLTASCCVLALILTWIMAR